MVNERRFFVRTVFFVFLILSGIIVNAQETVVYVDDSAVGANNGTSWTDAYNYLQDAIADANTAAKPVEIRIAQGVYTPDQGFGYTRGDRSVSFQLINGVTILGGFAGVEAVNPNVRCVRAFETIFSGDLAGDDADVDSSEELSGHPTMAENSYRVVLAYETDETAVLDGATITNTQSGISSYFGSFAINNCTFTNNRFGISIRDNNQTITNCTFKGNWLHAINLHGDGKLSLANCKFVGNEIGISGHSRGDLTLRDCLFTGDGVMNSRESIDFHGENLRLYNCEFKNIIAGNVAGAKARVEGEFIAENCAFTGNIGKAIDHSRGRMVISNCVIAGNSRGFFTSGINSWSEYVTIENCTFYGNSSETAGSALNLVFGGKVSNCIFWDNEQPAIDGRQHKLFMRYCNVQGGWPGEGNIDVDPYFVSPGYWEMNGTPDDVDDDFWVDGDYHLQSQAGHWDKQGQAWVQDELTSPCIDTGDPNSPIGTESFPNGGRVNMGAYGVGDKASKSYFDKPVCDVIIAGDINGDGIVDEEDLAILNSHWMMQGDDYINKLPIVTLIEPQDGDRIAWRGPTTFKAEADDPDGWVDEVRFYVQYKSGNSTSTYGFGDSDGSDSWLREFDWPEDAGFGEWTVWAEATDNEGMVGISPEIKINLYRP